MKRNAMDAVFWLQTLLFVIYFSGNGVQSSAQAPSNRAMTSRQRRSVVGLYQMISCATPCEPLSYKGYGCFCGFMGNGYPVDGIDRCCQKHDKCYSRASSCGSGMHYFTAYSFDCNNGYPTCRGGNGIFGRTIDCGKHLCHCDVAFVQCLKKNSCPKTRPVCRQSAWRYLQNRFMGALSGFGSF